MKIDVYMRFQCSHCSMQTEGWMPAHISGCPERLAAWGWTVYRDHPFEFNPRKDAVLCPKCHAENEAKQEG